MIGELLTHGPNGRTALSSSTMMSISRIYNHSEATASGQGILCGLCCEETFSAWSPSRLDVPKRITPIADRSIPPTAGPLRWRLPLQGCRLVIATNPPSQAMYKSVIPIFRRQPELRWRLLLHGCRLVIATNRPFQAMYKSVIPIFRRQPDRYGGGCHYKDVVWS
ncbi:hypothetical protein J6590_026505 [Homalodisca vitripennis]|nr:hypothetical protein J6590_026505 [Homalodisca vitripennis]